MRTRVVIGLPSFKEADSIQFVTQTVDQVGIFDPEECVLLNADSGSTDGTSKKFLNLPTRCRKEVINTGKENRGKGKNLLAIFQRAKQMNAEFVATIDTDLKTVNPTWATNLLAPIVTGSCDFVAPLYTRNRFEGSTTNHFAMPLILSLFGVSIRQPIGGEFAMRRQVSDYILTQSISENGKKYGIDISMIIHALGGAFKVGEVFLGQKFHKPSFPKIMPMFSQVSQAAFEVIRSYKNKGKILPGKYVSLPKSAGRSGIDQMSMFQHKTQIPLLLAGAIKAFGTDGKNYKDILDGIFPTIQKRLKGIEPHFDSDIWAEVLEHFVRKALSINENDTLFQKMGHLLAQIFIWRAATFWLEAENLSTEEVENHILLQAKTIQEKISPLFH